MNLALSALLILLFLLPAFSFRIGISVTFHKKNKQTAQQDFSTDLFSRNINKALAKLNFTETIFLFSLVPLILHLISILIIHLLGYSVDYSLLLNIFSGKDDILQNSSNEVFYQKLFSFLIYSVIQAILGYFLGLGMMAWLSGKEWLLRILMGNNIWFKIFSGASLTPEQKNSLAFILVEVLTVTKEASVIYFGWLKHYEVVQNSDELSYITLTGAKRRDLRAAQIVKQVNPAPLETHTAYQADYGTMIEIPGNNFTILGKEIINVNVTYMKYIQPPGGGNKVPAPII